MNNSDVSLMLPQPMQYARVLQGPVQWMPHHGPPMQQQQQCIPAPFTNNMQLIGPHQKMIALAPQLQSQPPQPYPMLNGFYSPPPAYTIGPQATLVGSNPGGNVLPYGISPQPTQYLSSPVCQPVTNGYNAPYAPHPFHPTLNQYQMVPQLQFQNQVQAVIPPGITQENLVLKFVNAQNGLQVNPAMSYNSGGCMHNGIHPGQAPIFGGIPNGYDKPALVNLGEDPNRTQNGLIAHPTPSSNNFDSWNNAVIDMDRAMALRTKTGMLINNRYKVQAKIGFGSYGTIYAAVDTMQPATMVAVKFETPKENERRVSIEEGHLRYEYEVYKVLSGGPKRKKKGKAPIPGVPRVYYFGEEDNQRLLVMSLLGPTLENLFTYCDRTFSRETIVNLGHQLLDRVQWLHERGFVHRDLKPENFLIGIGADEATLYLIDFGLARRYRYREDTRLVHIPHRKGKNLVGTAKYASLNSHLGIELSRRDDIESIGYILAELCCGELPWKESKNKARFRTKQQSYNRIRNIKENVDWRTVCPPVAQLIEYAKQMTFTEDPDYKKLKSWVDTILVYHGGEDNEDCERSTMKLEETCSEPAKNEELRDRLAALEINSAEPNLSSMVWNETERAPRHPGRLFRQCRWVDPSSEKFNWVVRRESSLEEMHRYQCLFRWIVPGRCE